jgi:radical SAM protein with 4Fe4S-binding SPASM domain
MKSVLEFSTYGVAIDRETPPNARARLNTGTLCNYNCEFCYYKKQLSIRTAYEKIVERIDDIWAYGLKEIDLSGGESSVEPNWFKILDYCQAKGFTNISTLSHGGKFADMEFLKESQAHGLKEILFSVHGSNAELHDKITDRKGSFVKIIQAIKNAHQAGIVVRINCTVYDLNHHTLPNEYTDLILELNPLEVNFITLNYDTDNSDFRTNDYGAVTDSIKLCIDRIKDRVKYINVRYTPFCYMVGYEQYVCNYYQHIYDKYDWNLAIYNHGIDTTKTYTELEKLQQSYEEAKKFRLNSYHKGKECLDCKYLFICDGVEKQLKDTPLKPVAGDKIHEINFYRKGFYDA